VYHLFPPDLVALVEPASGHIPASEFLKARPQFEGLNLFSPAVFNPTNSPNPSDWLYDPHWIEDDVYPVEYPTPAAADSPEVDALPDLVPLGQNQGYLFPFLDTTEIPGRNLLRFSTAIGNMGAGPVILLSANSGTPPAGSGITSWINADGTQNVLQLIYTYDSGANFFNFDHYRPAGRMVWHNGHGHFHLEGYATYRLLQNVGGTPGAQVIRDDGTPAIGDKVGFCLVNILQSFLLPNGQSSSTLPGYDPQGSQTLPSNNGQPLTTCGFQQGIHVGHADVYNAIYDGQWVDVTGVPNGDYFLEITLDALNVILESDDSNNTMAVPVTLNANPPVGGIQPDRFEPNNSFADATNLGVLGVQTQSGLTIHTTNENDFFRFEAASSGSYQVRLTIGDRDVNLFLYDDNQTLLTSSTAAQGLGGGSEIVIWNFVAGQTYYVRAQGFGSSLNPVTSGVSSNYALQVLVNPTVDVSTPDPSGNELGPDYGVISIARNGPTSGPLNVDFTVGGSATRGADYEIYHGGLLITGNSVSIGNEAATAELEIRPITDGDVETAENVTLTLNTSSAYVVGGSNSGQVTIADTGPQVSQTVHTWQTSPHLVSFTFSRDVFGVDAGDFAVLNLDTGLPVAASFSYDGITRKATLNFNGVLPDANYQATITGTGIQDAVGNTLQSDFRYSFFVLTGDADHDGRINLNDFNILAANFGQSGRDGSTGDFTYDGIANLDDFNVLAAKFGTVLATARFGHSGFGSPVSGLFGDSRAIEDDARLDELT
jgi:hypothetical protein